MTILNKTQVGSKLMIFNVRVFFVLTVSFLLISNCGRVRKKDSSKENQSLDLPEPLKIGYSISINDITPEKLSHAETVGIDYIELAGINSFYDKKGDFVKSDAEIEAIIKKTKKILDKTQIKVWSIHMGFSQFMDISTINEEDRKKVITMHKRLLRFLKVLKPEIILFHPSYYLAPNERDKHISHMIKSAKELNNTVKSIGATMVLENMLGPELMVGDRERPLMRTVEETVDIFNRLPPSIYSAIDMNHIKNPENLIRAMGDRLKHVHIADGTGMAENHYFPCSEKGNNDWVKILSALDGVGYTNPFIYESAYEDEKDLVECYESLYDKFVAKKYPSSAE